MSCGHQRWPTGQNSGIEPYRKPICRVRFGKYLSARLLLVGLRDDITLRLYLRFMSALWRENRGEGEPLLRCYSLLISADQVLSISLTTGSGIGIQSSPSAILSPLAKPHLKNSRAVADAALSADASGSSLRKRYLSILTRSEVSIFSSRRIRSPACHEAKFAGGGDAVDTANPQT
jgi:hypothetical protein